MREGFVRLGDVCTISGGYTPKQSQLFPEGDIPYFKVADMNRIGNEISLCYTDQYLKEARKVFPKGAIVFPKNGGAVATNKKRILAHDAVVDLNTGIAIPRERVDNQYLFYYFQGIDFKCFIKEGTLPVLRTKEIANLPFYFPSLPEQQRIVDILDRGFAKIDALKANAEKSLQAAKDLFQTTLKKELEPKEGWETKHLNEWATYSIGLTYKPADISKEGTIVLRSSNIQNDELVFDDIVRVACKVKDELFVENGDILMCSRNGSARLVGKVARIGKEQERMTYGTFMTIIRSKYNPILFYYFKSNDFRSQISKGENTMINQITKYMLNDVVISLPNDPGEVSRIARSLDTLNDRCKSLQENYQKILTLCDDLKQSLLRKAFNGEL